MPFREGCQLILFSIILCIIKFEFSKKFIKLSYQKIHILGTLVGAFNQ